MSIKTKTTKSKINIKVKAGLTKTGKTKVRGIKNGLDFKKHVKLVNKQVKSNPDLESFKTRYLRVGSPKSLIIPSHISSTTYDSVRFKEVSFSIGNRLPQALKQIYHNDLIVQGGVVYGFEKKHNKVSDSKSVDFTKSDVTIKLSGNTIVLTNYINNPRGKVYKMKFSSKVKSNTWFKEVLGVGIYKLVASYQKL